MTRTPLLVICLLAAASCGEPSTNNATAVLRDTAENLVKIDSGELSMRFSANPRDGDPGGFELEGPFSLVTDGSYPVAELEHRRFDGGDTEEGTFISDGTTVYIERDDRRRRVPDSQLRASGLADLARAGESGSEGNEDDDDSLAELNISEWIAGDLEISDGGSIEGTDTDLVSADLDVPRVINGFIDLGRVLGSGAAAQMEPIPDSELRRVRTAAREATLELWSGKRDRILRRLIAEITFEVPDDDFASKLGELGGGTLRLEATLGGVNDPVEIETP